MQSVPPKPRARHPFRRACIRTGATILLVVGSAACDDTDTAKMHAGMILGRPARAADDDARLAYRQRIPVQETDAVVNVNPALVPDPRGGLLVVDVSESQVRRYGEDGTLLWHAGRRGQGPGELTSPTAVGRMPTGEVVVADRGGRLTFYDSAGARTVRTAETRLSHLEELVVMDDSTLLLSGVGDGGTAGPRLHLWNTVRDTIAHSFFAPFPHQRNRVAASVAGYVEAAVRGDTVAAVFAASDTVYFFSRAGRALDQVPLRSAHFRPAPEREPGRTITNPVQRARWVSAFDFVADVEWLPDGTLLVAYQSLDADRALTRTWHLLGMTPSGDRTFEYRGFSRLLGTDSGRGLVYLVDQAADAPNEWAVARLPS